MKHLVYIFLLALVSQGCSDSQGSIEEESKTVVNSDEPTQDLQVNIKEQGEGEVDVDTIGMAEFLALKGVVAAKYREANALTDENDAEVDTTGFSAFKRSKSKTPAPPCDCEDSIKAKRKTNSRNAKAKTTEKSEETDSDDEAEISDQAEVAEDSATTSGHLQEF